MRRLRALLMTALVLGVTACASLDRTDAATATAGDPADGGRQILVMLRLAPPHFRPDGNYAGSYDARFGREARRMTAQQLAAEHHLRLVSDWPMPTLGVDCFVMEVAAGDSPALAAERVAGDRRVESAQPVNTFHTLGHDDPLFALQPAAREWRLADLHEVATGRHAIIAQIDTGVDLDHPDLRGQVALARNFVDGSPYAAEAHGTAVAGIIAARADNGIGIAGIAPGATLLALRACWQQAVERSAASCNSFTLAKALQFALSRNVQVINLSLSGPRDRLLERLLDAALGLDITIVGAADPDNRLAFPGSHPGVIRVAAQGTSGGAVDVVLAPGRDIPTTLPGGRWDFVSGASFATAHVTGMVALLRELLPRMRPAEVRDALNAPAMRRTPAGPWLVDACATVGRAAGARVCASAPDARSALDANGHP